MDTKRLISDLLCEKALIERAIDHLRSLDRAEARGTQSVPKRRGRKFMDPVERQRVSERMRHYWAERRATKESQAAA